MRLEKKLHGSLIRRLRGKVQFRVSQLNQEDKSCILEGKTKEVNVITETSSGQIPALQMLCVILVASGALDEITPVPKVETPAATPEPKEAVDDKLLAFDTNLNWDAEEGPCCKLCYTQWFDRDNPSGNGDYETLAQLRDQYPGRICRQPCAIQVQTLSGVNAYTTGQVFQNYDTVTGFACVNKQQPKYKCCLDYKVRFACPC